MFDILEEVVEHIMLFLNIPNRPILSAVVKGILISFIIFIVMRGARLFFQDITSAYIIDDAKLCIASGIFLAAISLFFDLIEKK